MVGGRAVNPEGGWAGRAGSTYLWRRKRCGRVRGGGSQPLDTLSPFPKTRRRPSRGI